MTFHVTTNVDINNPCWLDSTKRKSTWQLRAEWDVVKRQTDIPGRIESLDGLLLITPARRVLIFTGSPSTGHGALHVTRDDMPQGLPHLGVLCCRNPSISCREKMKKETIWLYSSVLSACTSYSWSYHQALNYKTLALSSVVTSPGLAISGRLRLVHADGHNDSVGVGWQDL